MFFKIEDLKKERKEIYVSEKSFQRSVLYNRNFYGSKLFLENSQYTKRSQIGFHTKFRVSKKTIFFIFFVRKKKKKKTVINVSFLGTNLRRKQRKKGNEKAECVFRF